MEIRCKKCGSAERQIKKGVTTAGSQCYYCNICKSRYTPNPKRYSEKEKKLVQKLLLSGNSGRKVGKIMGISKNTAYRLGKSSRKKSWRRYG